jgi:hypothetical protein
MSLPTKSSKSSLEQRSVQPETKRDKF